MNRFILVVICSIILGGIITCKKKNSSAPVPLCTTCSTALVAHKADSTGLYYFLPTAFTPNGDGINDLFRVEYSGLNIDSSSLTIWDAKGKGVYTGGITQSWNGVDFSGNKCPAGKYNVYMKLKTTSGQSVTACTCITILAFNGSCIDTKRVTYYFEDQLDPANGFVYPTNETLCP